MLGILKPSFLLNRRHSVGVEGNISLYASILPRGRFYTHHGNDIPTRATSNRNRATNTTPTQHNNRENNKINNINA